jgi:hypothetical protein
VSSPSHLIVARGAFCARRVRAAGHKRSRSGSCLRTTTQFVSQSRPRKKTRVCGPQIGCRDERVDKVERKEIRPSLSRRATRTRLTPAAAAVENGEERCNEASHCFPQRAAQKTDTPPLEFLPPCATSTPPPRTASSAGPMN